MMSRSVRTFCLPAVRNQIFQKHWRPRFNFFKIPKAFSKLSAFKLKKSILFCPEALNENFKSVCDFNWYRNGDWNCQLSFSNWQQNDWKSFNKKLKFDEKLLKALSHYNNTLDINLGCNTGNSSITIHCQQTTPESKNNFKETFPRSLSRFALLLVRKLPLKYNVANNNEIWYIFCRFCFLSKYYTTIRGNSQWMILNSHLKCRLHRQMSWPEVTRTNPRWLMRLKIDFQFFVGYAPCRSQHTPGCFQRPRRKLLLLETKLLWREKRKKRNNEATTMNEYFMTQQ